MLKRKLWRDIKGNWGAYVACISVLVIGMMLYVSMTLMLESLTASKDKYYRNFGFADGFVHIVRGPAGLVEDISGVVGIDKVIGRIVQDVLVYRPTGEETTTIRLVSFRDARQPLNRFKLEEGRLPAEESRELVVSPAFLTANNLKIGSQLPLIFQGKAVDFTITGTAKSPEYVYEIPSGQTLTPDPKAFGVAFIPYSSLAPLVGMEGQINDLAFSLQPGTNFSRVKLPVTRLLGHYGLTQLIPSKDQLSNSMLSQEIVQLKGSATTTPVIFLLVAASILYIMLKRMVEHQRGQIGFLKAFGFTDREILGHYLGYAVLVGTFGGLSGGLTGIWFSYQLAKIYQQYYNIPDLTGKFSLGYLLVGTILALVFSLLAGYQGCKGVLELTPAEAMRAPTPKLGSRTLLERVKLLWNNLSTQAKMAVRNVFRSKQRSILVIVGIASAFSMMVASRASFDAIYYLVDFQYDQVERYDIKIGLRGYVDKDAGVTAAKNLPGVTQAEPMLEVPATISHKWLEKDIAITGLPKNASLYRLLTKEGTAVTLPSNGLVISTQMAKVLNVRLGDQVKIKPFFGERKEYHMMVRKIIPQYVGVGAYMELEALGETLQLSDKASSILVGADSWKVNQVRKELQSGKNVATIYDKTKMKAQFEKLMESSHASQYILLIFAFITGFAIVYNVNIISLAERERELATLMVLGMTEGEISRILLFEQGLLGLIALSVGLPMSYGMLYAIVNASSTDIFNMPLIIEPLSLGIAAVGSFLFLLAAHWRITNKIGQLSMLDVLKQQD